MMLDERPRVVATVPSGGRQALNEIDVGTYLTFRKLSPPLRSDDDRRAMVQGVVDGTIDAVVSSHDPQAPDTGAESTTPDQAATPEARLAEAEARAEQYREDLLRAAAEMDNVRKRAAREIDAARQYGIERFAGELLPVADSLALGLESPAVDPAALREGQEATLRLLIKAFERVGLAEIDPTGQPFDPARHEAMATRPSAEYPSHTVLQVVQRGWLLNGRLLRAARVIVSTLPEKAPDPGAAGG